MEQELVSKKDSFTNARFTKETPLTHNRCLNKEFQRLPISGGGGKFELLKQVNAYFVCFGEQKCKKIKKKQEKKLVIKLMLM